MSLHDKSTMWRPIKSTRLLPDKNATLSLDKNPDRNRDNNLDRSTLLPPGKNTTLRLDKNVMSSLDRSHHNLSNSRSRPSRPSLPSTITHNEGYNRTRVWYKHSSKPAKTTNKAKYRTMTIQQTE